MTTKYHITDDGPKPCGAKAGNCPLNDGKADHFTDKKEASAAFEKTFKTFPKIIRKGLPQLELVAGLQPKKGGSYYGLTVSNDLVEDHLKAWREVVGIDESDFMEHNKVERDGDYAFHVTVLSPKDTRTLRKAGEKVELKDFTVKMVGVGSVEDGDKEAWFILCESDEIDEYRTNKGLAKHYLHITIGFINNDVHNVRKDFSTLKII